MTSILSYDLLSGRHLDRILKLNICKCGHSKERHFDLIDEDSGGHLRGDWGCWECEENGKECNERM